MSRRAAGIALFASFIACGGMAPASISLTPVPGSQQLLFVLLAGALLGSRMGAVSAFVYLLFSSLTGLAWPAGAGPDPFIGPVSGFLWSLPIAAYLSGFAVEKLRGESPAHFAIGAAAAIAAYHAMGTLRLIALLEIGSPEAFVKGVGIFLGQHIAQGAIAVMIASSLSDLIRAREEK
jgi:biotin transport system substrate-specific component